MHAMQPTRDTTDTFRHGKTGKCLPLPAGPLHVCMCCVWLQVVGENVMLTVATSEAVTGPTRLLFPRMAGSSGEGSSFPFSLLGLGDVAIPGLLACLALRWASPACMLGQLRPLNVLAKRLRCGKLSTRINPAAWQSPGSAVRLSVFLWPA